MGTPSLDHDPRSTVIPGPPPAAVAVGEAPRAVVGDHPPASRADRLVMVAMLGGAGALAAAGPGMRRRLAPVVGKHLAEAATTALLSGAGWAMIAGLERARPYRRSWNEQDGDVVTDLGYALVSTPPIGMAATAIVEVARAHLARATGPQFGRWWPRRAPLVARVVLATAITELVHYGHHRASHEFEPLWRFHRIHHTPQRLYWLNSGRFHPVDVFPLFTLQLLPLRLLGVDDDAFTVVQVFKGIHGQIQHSNVRARGGPLNGVFSTLEQHRWHHALTVEEGSNANYGAVLSVFDRLFGTYSLPARPLDAEIGVRASEAIPRRFGAQLREPFRRRQR